MANPLLSFLSNEYFLLSTTPYLLPADLAALARTSRSLYGLITHSRSVWRHLDLSLAARPPPATSSAVDFLATSAPVRSPFRYESKLGGLLSKHFVLRDVKTLILDGLPVDHVFLSRLLMGDTYRIQILSIRDCLHINERELQNLLQYLLRTTRDRSELKLKGIYYFGAADYNRQGVVEKKNAQFIHPSRITQGWVGMLNACAGQIAFDTRLCTGPRHERGTEEQRFRRIASVRLTGGCAGCGTTPERRENKEVGLERVLRAPIPVMTSDVKVACAGGPETEVLRCQSCVQDMWCHGCEKWWCEDCVEMIPKQKRIADECIECGPMCHDCNNITTRTCKACRGSFCLTHSPEADDNHVFLPPTPLIPTNPPRRCVCRRVSRARY
ncbi:hypothetical protein EX30DRAFT_219736 [Ascodesmis nigricans]|uniref:F-box domain-containing protein n=1 Tax=Ascodesmis nigricans TaxID=341454 RepID=A0A4S2MZU0_9PEZI|nr:hypothetical protein EX30DRAFT_219736 [Ascodesmis nigricans]